MTSAMSVAMSPMQVPSRIGGSASMASKVRVSNQPPKVGQLWSFLGTVPLPPVWCGPAWDADFRVHEIVIRSDSGASKGGRRTLTQRMSGGPPALSEYNPNVLVPCSAVGALERIGHATFRGAKKCSEERACCLLRNPAVVCRFR